MAPPQSQLGELTTLTQTSSWWAWGRINSQHSHNCYLTSSVPPLKKKTILWIAIRHDASAINSNATSLILHKIRGYFVENCNEENSK